MNKMWIFYSILFTCLISSVLSQDDDYEEHEEEEEESDVNDTGSGGSTEQRTTVRTPIAFYPFYSFAEQFKLLTEPKVHPAVSNSSTIASSNSSSNATTPSTKRPQRRTTTEQTRAGEVGQGVNGILVSAGNFNIPALVDQALSIRNNEPVRKLVKGILDTIFCFPVLSNLSDCGKRQAAAAAKAAAAAAAEAAARSTTPKTKVKRTTTTSPDATTESVGTTTTDSKKLS